MHIHHFHSIFEILNFKKIQAQFVSLKKKQVFYKNIDGLKKLYAMCSKQSLFCDFEYVS